MASKHAEAAAEEAPAEAAAAEDVQKVLHFNFFTFLN